MRLLLLELSDSFPTLDSPVFDSGSFDGRVVSFSLDGRCSEIIKQSSSSAVTALASSGNAFFSVGMDGSVKKVEGSKVR